MIPFWITTHRATVTGSKDVGVKCSNCSSNYVFRVTRTVTGTGSSVYSLDNRGASDRASKSAQKNLGVVLYRAMDAVPCPACGWYQDFMIPLLRKQKWQWMSPIVVAFGILSLIALIFSMALTSQYQERPGIESYRQMNLAWIAFSVNMSIAIFFPVLKYLKFRNLDPNEEDQEARRSFAKTRAITRAESEKDLSGGGLTATKKTSRSNQARLVEEMANLRSQPVRRSFLLIASQ